MAGQTTVSPLLGKLGATLVKAHEQVKDKAPVVGNIQLPPGIENGVAELRTLKIGTYDKGDTKGQPFFMASASVLQPLSHNNTKVEGLFTRIGPLPLCDTKGKDPQTGAPRTVPFVEHYDKFTNHLKNLGFDISKVVPPANLSDPQKAEYIEKALLAGMEALVNRKPKITLRFRTWAGSKQELRQEGGKWAVYDGKKFKGSFATEEDARKVYPYLGKDPLVNHEWNGTVEYNGVADSGVNDQTHVQNGVMTSEPDAPVVDEPAAAPDEPAFDEFADDPATLAKRASDTDDAVAIPAQEKLTAMADAAGIAKNPDGSYPGESWDDLAAMIVAGGATVGTEPPVTDAEPEAFTPELKKVYKWKEKDAEGKLVKDTKTKRPKPAIEVVVKAIDATTRTCTCTDNLTKKKSYKNVLFDDLED